MIAITTLILTSLIVLFCNYFVDIQTALFIDRVFSRHHVWHRYTGDMPDVLFMFVCIVTLSACAGYQYRKKRGIYDAHTMFFKLVACAVPASFVVKSILKFMFGRITTRAWLLHPDLYGFHWFQGGGRYDGFPSGHMAVVVTLAATVWRAYPRYRSGCAGVTVLLAGALIATNYHFVGDVVAGTYLGILVEAGVRQTLNRHHPPL